MYTAREGLGIIKHLAPYLPVSTLDQIYKMYVRPHLDFCDVIFHKYSFYLHCIQAWNDIVPELANAVSFSAFKSNIATLIRPRKRETSSATCWSKSFTKRDILPVTHPRKFVVVIQESETTEHYFTRCITFADERKILMDSITPILTSKDSYGFYYSYIDFQRFLWILLLLYRLLKILMDSITPILTSKDSYGFYYSYIDF